jgi:rhamnose transport system permease protein
VTSTPTSAPQRRPEILSRIRIGSFRELGLLLFIAALIIIVQMSNSAFLTPKNVSNLLTNTAIIAVLSVGMFVVILTGGIDLSIGANIAFTGMVVALHVAAAPTLHPLIAMLEGLAIGIILGAIVGALVAKVHVLPIIASLGMCYVFRGAVFLISGGKWVSAHQMPEGFKAIATGSTLWINNLVLIAVVVMLIAQYVLSSTRVGRRFYAVGSNADAARISGISGDRAVWLAYVVMGGLAGLAGVLWVAKFASAQPDTAIGYEVNIIAACVIGGVSINGGSGKVVGVLLGTMLIGIINNALPLISSVSEFSKSFIQGMIILGAVLLNTAVKRRGDWRALAARHI